MQLLNKIKVLLLAFSTIFLTCRQNALINIQVHSPNKVHSIFLVRFERIEMNVL